MSVEFTGDDGAGGGGRVGLPGSTIGLLPPSGQTDKLALLEAAIGKAVPLAYGLHLIGGNEIFNQELTPGGERVVFTALGEGEMDGIVALFVNGKLFDHTDTTRCHFHPGLDGELGTESDPTIRNQKICSLWPSSFTDKFTFSRTAYQALKLAPDPAAPEAVPRIIGIYRGRKVRIFDSGGTQTAFQYSANNADIYADLLVSAFVKPRGLINEALTAGEKAFFDFGALDTFRSDCDVATPQGTKRFEAHPAFYSSTDLLRALELLFLLSRGYHLEKAGKFAPFMNKVRASALTLGPNDFAQGSFSVGERDTRDAANRYLGKFRNLDAGKGAGTIATTGTAVTGTGTKFLAWFRAGSSPIRLEDGAQAGQVRKVASIASDTAMTLASAFSADQAGRAYSNPELTLSKSSKQTEDETHQTEVGRILTLELDLHNQVPERAERIVKYTKAKALDVVKQTGLRALWIPGVLDLLPGDVFTAPGKWDFYDAANNQDYDLLKLVINQNMTFELGGEKYDAALYSDAAGAQQAVAPSIPGTGLSPNATPLTAPVAPTWTAMDGRGGEFRGDLASGAGNLAPIEHQVEMASDAGFSANIEDFALGTASKFNFYRPGLARYWRARSRYANGAWSGWTNFGAPTAVNSLLIDLDGDAQDGAIFLRSPQRTASSIAVENANFEAGSSLPPPGWYELSATLSYETATQYSGTRSLKVVTTVQYGAALSLRRWAVRPGEKYKVSARMKCGGTPTFGIACQLIFYDLNGGYISGIQPGTTSTSWVLAELNGTAPAGAVSAGLSLQIQDVGGGTGYFDEIFVSRLRNLDDEVDDGATYGRPKLTALTAGEVDLSKAGVINRNADNIAEAATRKWAAESGADITGGHTAFDTARVNAVAAATVQDGAGRASTNIAANGTYAPDKYHQSAVRRKATTLRAADTGAFPTPGTWIDGASWVIHLPPNRTQYGGSISVLQLGNPTTWTSKGRIRIGSNFSNAISFSDPTTTLAGVVTITGLTADSDITIVVQAYMGYTGGTSNVRTTANFSEVEYTDQDVAAI